MELSTTASGRLTPHLDMVEELKFGQMAASTRDTGRPIKQMAEEDSFMPMDISTMDSGKMIKLMDLASDKSFLKSKRIIINTTTIRLIIRVFGSTDSLRWRTRKVAQTMAPTALASDH